MDIKMFFSKAGLTSLAVRLSEITGNEFSAQQLNHWKKRGVPYKWQDVFTKISGIPKDKLK